MNKQVSSPTGGYGGCSGSASGTGGCSTNVIPSKENENRQGMTFCINKIMQLTALVNFHSQHMQRKGRIWEVLRKKIILK